MNTSYKFLGVFVFLVGVVTFSEARRNQVDSDVQPAQPFVVRYVETQRGSDGRVRVALKRTRYVKSNGEWKEIVHRGTASQGATESTSARGSVAYAGTADGVYAKPSNSNERSLLSPFGGQEKRGPFRSAAMLRSHPEFARMDVVAGLEVFVLRVEVPGYWIERSYSPKTADTPLRTVAHFGDGYEVRIEATNIEFRDVPEDLNDDIQAMPVKPSRSGSG